MALAEDPVRIFAAGSLRPAFESLRGTFEQKVGGAVAITYGPSGRLVERIIAGTPVDVFASASMTHTDVLLRAGLLRSSQPMARNGLCLAAAPGVDVTQSNLLERMLDPALRLGMSTPGADPMGDYTLELFRNLDHEQPGSYDRLERKARRLTGNVSSLVTEGLPYAALFREPRQTDLFVLYCTNAAVTANEVPGVTYRSFPAAVDVQVVYGIGVAQRASQLADQFVAYVLGTEGRLVFERFGFR